MRGALPTALAGLLLLAGATARATDWPQFHVDPAHAGVTGDDGPSSFNVRWKVASEDDVNGAPTVVGGRAYFVNEDGVLRCVDASDGSTVWSRHGLGGYNRAAPAVAGGKVYLGKGPNNDGIVCLDAANGTALWTKDEGFGEVPGSITVADTLLYYATNAGYVVCRDARSGDLLWYDDADGQFWSSPSLDTEDRRVYATRLDGRVICLPMDNPHPGTLKLSDTDRHWTRTTNGGISGSAALYDVDDANQIFVGTDAGQLYWLRDDGNVCTVVRSAGVSGAIRGTPCVNISGVWVGTDGDKVYGFDRLNGSERWNFDTGGEVRSSPAVANQRMYFTSGTEDFALYALDPYTAGPAVWKDQTYHYQYSSPAAVDGVLYVGDIGDESCDLLAVGPQSGSSASTSACHPVAPDVLRVRFDRAVTPASATSTANYALASSVPVTTAAMDGDRAVLLTLGAPLSAETADALTVSGIVAVGGDPMPGPQTVSFWGGIHSAAQLQAPDPAFLAGSPCEDRSRFAGDGARLGDPVALRAVCTARVGNWYAVQDEAGGPRSGLLVAAPPGPLVPGHRYLLAGRIHESAGETTMRDVLLVTDEGGVDPAPAPLALSIAVLADRQCDPGQALETAEDYEGMRVALADAELASSQGPGLNFTVHVTSAPGATLGVDVETGHFALAPNGMTFPCVLGGVLRETDGVSSLMTWSAGGTLDVPGPMPGAPGANVALSIRPNPSGAPRLVFVLPRTAAVDLAVFDVAGRRVRTLARGMFGAGTHERAWDGADDAGRPAGAGLYFFRLAAAGATRVVRGALVR